MPHLSLLEKAISEADSLLRTVFTPKKHLSHRSNPSQGLPEPSLSVKEQRHIASLMRVNHTGEICAQALYQGQAYTAELAHVKEQMKTAAEEEVDHLIWCEQRIQELNSRTSLLNPLWYSGSFLLGALAGLAGDRWSLGFVAETERQVTAHLEKHLQDIPPQDTKTKAILDQMRADEAHHAQTAEEAGGAELPVIIKQLMRVMSKFMTYSSYYI